MFQPLHVRVGDIFVRPDDHWCILAFYDFAKVIEKFEAVHLRHQKVEHDSGELRADSLLKRAGAILVAYDFITGGLKTDPGEFQGFQIVIHRRGAIGCFSQSAKPPKRNAAAVLGFIVASPGMILLKKRDIAPPAEERQRANNGSQDTCPVYAFIEMVTFGLFEGFMISPAARRRLHA